MRPGSGRKSGLTEQESSRILALAKQAPPGHLEAQADGTMVARDEQGSAQWSLDALLRLLKRLASRSNAVRSVASICVKACGFRHTHSWGESSDPDIVSKEPRSSATTPNRPKGRRRVTHRRTGASSPPHLSPRTRLVCHGAPHQSAAGLQPWS
jgi:hypothetical protein